MFTHKLFVLVTMGAAVGLAQTPVLTYHNDNSRTGYNNNETILTWSNVNVNSFKRLLSYTLDGNVYAQPLYFPGLTAGGSTHNVIFAATENNSVYALDADSSNVLWHANFNTGPSGVTVTPVPSSDVSCNFVSPVIGITSTPVIDPASLTIYVVAKTKEVSSSGTNYFFRLHALNIANGQETFGGPVAIQGSVAGSCGNTDGHGNIVFNPLIQHQRAGLLEVNGTIYLAFGSNCDVGAYSGWLIGYNATSLQQTSIFNTAPDGTGNCRAAIWQSGAGPGADASGNIFGIVANGSFDANTGGNNYGDSFLKWNPGGASVNDYFTPSNQAQLSRADLDLGSGPLLLPPQPGPAPNLLVGAGKAGTIYLLNRDNLGKFNRRKDAVIQEIPNAFGSGTAFPMGAFVNQAVYYAANSDNLRGFALTNGLLGTTPFATSANTFGSRGAGLSTSSDSSGNNAIVWALDFASPAVLHAYKATDLTELYNSTQASGGRDNPGNGVQFATPTVSGGKVFVGTANSVAVFGNF